MEEVSANICYRWFLGYRLQEETPHFSTVSYNFRHRFTAETNVHDSVAFDEVYSKVTERFPEVETVVADSAYKTPHICKKVFRDKRVLSTAYKRPQTTKGGHEWWKYVYDEFSDCVNCPTREKCTHSKNCVKTVQRHIWKEYEDLADDARYTPEYRDLYKLRKETIERIFADAKEKHAMRYTQYRGLAQVTNWVKLKFAAMNLKRLAKWKWKNSHSHLFELIFSTIMIKSRLQLDVQPAFSPPTNSLYDFHARVKIVYFNYFAMPSHSKKRVFLTALQML